MKKVLSILFVLVIRSSFLESAALLDDVTKRFTAPSIFDAAMEARKKLIADLEKERNHLESTQPEFIESTEKEIASLGNQIAQIRQELQKQPDDEFLLKKLSLFNENLQVLKDKIKVRKQLIEDKSELIKITTEVLSDPNLEEFKKEQKLFQKSAYTFEDIQTIKQKVIEAKKNIAYLDNQAKNINIEIEGRRRIITSLDEIFKKKKEEFEAAMSAESEPSGLDKREQREFFSYEEKLYKDKAEFERLRLDEIETKKNLINKKKFLADTQLNILISALDRAKTFIRITEADIVNAKDKLAAKQREYFNRIEVFSKELERRKEREQELDALSKRFNIALGPDVDDWSREPKQTVEGYLALLEVGALNDQVLLGRLEKELLEARMDLEKERLEQESLFVTIQETYFKIAANRFRTAEEITREIDKYETLKAKARSAVSKFEGKKITAADRLDIQKKALENIRKLRNAVEGQSGLLFKNFTRDYSKVLSLLNSIEENILKQIAELGKIIDVYTDIINTNRSSLQQIDLIVPDLPGTLQVLRRPETAISWNALRSIIPDTKMFFLDLYHYIISLNVAALVDKVQLIISRPYELIIFFIQFLLLAILLILLRLYFPQFARLLRSLYIERYWIKPLVNLITFFSNFFVNYFFGIAFWALSFFTFYSLRVVDPYFTVVFYLGSIPYLLYLSYRLASEFIQFNEQEGYCFLQKEYQYRFVHVTVFALYAVICITLFKESFQLLSYPKSELPRTFGVLSIIIAQIAIILLLSKEQILGLIPTANPIGRAIRSFVAHYYYLVLPLVIAIIIMSNPYVGYGPLVWYILTRLIYTAGIIIVLYWLHIFLRRVSSSLFFSRQEDVVKERFSYSKTFYGLYVILIFITLIFVGLFLCAKIWGWPEALARVTSWADIQSWIYAPFVLKDTESPISLASILQFILILLGGAVISYLFNRFVLGRIFDVLLVEPGIQNAIVTLTRYLIIFSALIFGLHSLGIWQQAWWLAAALVGIGWVIKEPLSDFVAYMIILVQRPLKIGDYIKIDDQTMGVVRKITARAVILRRKNSTTYVVPNTQIIKRVVVNWNYRPGFVAFDDIFVSIPYKEDPAAIRELLLQVCDDNPYILKNPKPVVRLDSFGDSGFDFRIRGFVSSNYTLEIWNIASSVRIEIVHTLRKRGIELAVPIRKIINASQPFTQGLLFEQQDKL